MHHHTITATFAAVCLMALPCRAHWDIGGPHKMHFPQLPDMAGWDVDVCHYTLADDWMCTEAGPVQQVHFWISWTNDVIGIITNVHLSIHSDFPGPPYSHPAELIWQDDFDPAQFSLRVWGSGPQGWYDPISNWWIRPDHLMVFQVNVPLKAGNPFLQVPGTIYWLDIRLGVVNGLAGWKSSMDHFNDDATVWDGGEVMWKELRDPLEPLQSLDLAFVIDPIPEPALPLALSVCAGCLVRTRRRRSEIWDEAAANGYSPLLEG